MRKKLPDNHQGTVSSQVSTKKLKIKKQAILILPRETEYRDKRPFFASNQKTIHFQNRENGAA